MPKWSQYLEEDDLDNETPITTFQKIKRKSGHVEDVGRGTNKKTTPQPADSPLTR